VDIENIDCPIELQLQEQKLALARKLVRWNACASTLKPIVNALGKLGIEPNLDDNDLNVCFTGDKEKLTQAMRILRTSGFSTSSAKPKPGDAGWYAYFTKPECPLSIWFNFSSAVCRRVKVGTKLVEQDVYEVQCGDISQD
jgi:hypothetical protein